MIKIWKKYLIIALKLFLEISKNTSYFKLKTVIFFISINILFYWIAMVVAFPELIFGSSSLEYFLLQFPVGILGGFFDSLSLIITIYIIKRAITSYSSFMYLAHLSIDLLIACIATMWVLFVFIFSGWLISFLILNPENLLIRKDIYEERIISAINNPTGKSELKNIFFGIIMGLSAMLPTLLHLYLFLKSIKTFLKNKIKVY
tara:strand:+ start:39 stop:647 length:609 start_codon:yes stop_codon:yes gene_type:complete